MFKKLSTTNSPLQQLIVSSKVWERLIAILAKKGAHNRYYKFYVDFQQKQYLYKVLA